MKKIVILSIICLSFWAQNAYAVSVCPKVFWAFAGQNNCATDNYNFSLFVCPDQMNQPGVVFDHVEWNYGDGTIISNTSFNSTHNYSLDGNYTVSATVYFEVDGVSCASLAVTQDGIIGSPVTGMSITIVSDPDYFCNNSGYPTSNYVTAVVVTLNVDLFIDPIANSYPASSSTALIFKADISSMAPGQLAPWTLHIDNSINPVASGNFTSNGVMAIHTAQANTFTVGTHVAELTVTDRNTTDCPVVKVIPFEIDLIPPPPPCPDCFTFKPDQNKRYWVSAWVKVVDANALPTSIPQVISYDSGLDATSPGIELSFVGSVTAPIYFRPSGDIIEGWQRIAGEFITPSGATEVNIKLNNPVPGPELNKVAYFDDVRIHPFNGSMKSYVNDPDTFWLTAELDDNNYATFYEYDMEGKLIRIKKETNKGIVTIKENRSSNPKTN
jgi:hypothetical protein